MCWITYRMEAKGVHMLGSLLYGRRLLRRPLRQLYPRRSSSHRRALMNMRNQGLSSL